MNIFVGYEDFVDIFEGSSQTISGSFLCILGSFLNVKEQNGGYFWGYKNFKYFLGVLEFPNVFWG